MSRGECQPIPAVEVAAGVLRPGRVGSASRWCEVWPLCLPFALYGSSAHSQPTPTLAPKGVGRLARPHFLLFRHQK